MLTIDTGVSGQRERDLRNGATALASGNPLRMLPHAGQILARPRWLAGCLRDGGLMKFPNVVLSHGGPMHYADVAAALAQSTVAWSDISMDSRCLERSGSSSRAVLTGDDARRAIDAGADAIVVSNHGGRQLDGVAPTVRALPEVIDAVNGRVEVLLDSGVRRGSDVVKALCLGARAVLIGRAYAYGLGAAGAAGVAKAIDILRNDVARTLRLLGCADVASLDRSYVDGERNGAT